MYRTITLARDGAIATITLNRPDKLNAYTVRMGEEIVDAFTGLRDNDEVRVVIVTGAGRGFCAGVDLDELKRRDDPDWPQDLPRLGEEHFVRGFCEDLYDFPKPVIAAVNGAAVGVGATMILPCDLRIAAQSARFSFPFIRLGILPGLGSSYLLPRLVGPAKARELIYTAEPISADEAAAIGLVNQVIADDRLVDEAREIAEALADCPPATLAAAKQLLNVGSSADSLADAAANERRQSEALRHQPKR